MLDLWSKVSEASRRYSTSTGESEHAGLEESLGANLTDMRRFEERASLARQESESWSEQAARVRSEAQAIDRELGQPFFVWLSERTGADGRPIGAAGAVRLASPQTPEDAEVLRSHAAAFVAERFPAPAGPDPATVGSETEYGVARDTLTDAYARETATAHGGWSEGVRDRARAAGTPAPGEVEAGARLGRAETKADMTVNEAGREARRTIAREGAREGRAGVSAEKEKPFEHHATENVPVIGEWLAGRLFGTVKNEAPDGTEETVPAVEDGEPVATGKTGRAPHGKTSSGGAMAVEGGSPNTVFVAQPLLVVAEPLVAPRARGPLVEPAAVAGKPVAAEGHPVAVPEPARQRAREAREHGPGERREPQRGEDIGLRPGCRGQGGDGQRSEHECAPGTASWRRRLAGRACGVAGHGRGLRGRVGRAGGAGPSGRARLAPSPARLRLAAARSRPSPYRRPCGRFDTHPARKRAW